VEKLLLFKKAGHLGRYADCPSKGHPSSRQSHPLSFFKGERKTLQRNSSRESSLFYFLVNILASS